MVGNDVQLIERYQPFDDMRPYERLLGDALPADHTSFGDQDSVEESWRIVGPVLDQSSALDLYDSSSWGAGRCGSARAEVGGWITPAVASDSYRCAGSSARDAPRLEFPAIQASPWKRRGEDAAFDWAVNRA